MGVCKITPKPIVELQFGTIIHTELKAVNLRFLLVDLVAIQNFYLLTYLLRLVDE